MPPASRAWLGFACLAVVEALLLFGAAGTVHYWQAWVYLGVFFGPACLITLDLLRRDPALLERRLRAGPTAEKETAQKIIMLVTSLGYIGLLVVPGLDRRFEWSSVPVPVVVAGDALTVLGLFIVFRVYRENPFSSATIEVMSDQRVISTGPYAVVRHPMYAGGALLLLGMSPALGSWWGILPFAVTLPALFWRLVDEEKLLAKNLPGYVEYCAKVQWRLIPRVL
jgi:protein-S-isoprenylcysteine O-methyltransferase Ste14